MMSDVEELVKREPWRRGLGQPLNALDPTWNIERSIECDGGYDYYADGSGWWFCKKCGYHGRSSYHGHKPINDPSVFFLHSVDDFLAKRKAQGVVMETAVAQMMYIAGVVLRYAASVKPEQLGDYVQQLVVR